MFTWRDVDAWKTDYADRSMPMQLIAVEPKLSSAPTALFVSMVNVAYENKPDKRSPRGAATFQLDATNARTIGMQAQFVDGCYSDVMTTAPGGKAISLPVGRLEPKCVLRMRMCAVPTNPLLNAGNSCAASIVDGFMTNLKLLPAIDLGQ